MHARAKRSLVGWTLEMMQAPHLRLCALCGPRVEEVDVDVAAASALLHTALHVAEDVAAGMHGLEGGLVGRVGGGVGR